MAQFQMSQKHYKVHCILEELIALYCSKFRFTADSLSVVSFSFRWTHFPPKHTQTYIFAHTTHLLCLYNELMQPPPREKDCWLGLCFALKPAVCRPRSHLGKLPKRNIKIDTFPSSFPAWVAFLSLLRPPLVRNCCLTPQATTCPANLVFNQSLNSVLASWTHKAI